MPTVARHHILYDVERWRRARTWLLLPGTVCALTAILVTVLKPASGGALGYTVVAVALYTVATSLWSRQRFSYMACEGDRLVVRTLGSVRRLGGADIDRVRVMRLSAVFNRPDRRGLLPRPTDRWLATDAVAVRLRESADTRGLARMLGRRCVVDDLLLVPVTDSAGLVAELVAAVVPPPVRAQAAAGHRRRSRRR